MRAGNFAEAATGRCVLHDIKYFFPLPFPHPSFFFFFLHWTKGARPFSLSSLNKPCTDIFQTYTAEFF